MCACMHVSVNLCVYVCMLVNLARAGDDSTRSPPLLDSQTSTQQLVVSLVDKGSIGECIRG